MVDIMTEDEAESIARLLYRNRARVAVATQCGCSFCQATFQSNEVREWLDNYRTALCPRCGIDSVLTGVTDPGALRMLHYYRFEVTVPSSDAWTRNAAASGTVKK
jgi:hypothetical protein